jgi:hypothetical protein
LAASIQNAHHIYQISLRKGVNMPKKISIAVLVIIVLTFLGWGAISIVDNPNSAELAVTANASNVGNLYISSDGTLINYDGVAGEAALATLKKLTTVETASYSSGELVTSINGLAQNESTGQYWSFYVNGQMAAVGAGSYVSAQGDKIEWKLEAF